VRFFHQYPFAKKLQSQNVTEKKLCKALSYEKLARKNADEIDPCMQFGFVIFCQKNIGAKSARKMLIKLTRDHFRPHYLLR